MSARPRGWMVLVMLLAAIGGVLSAEAAEQTGRLRERLRARLQGRREARQANQQAPSDSPGDSQGSIMVDGRQRTYLAHLPSGYSPATRCPLLLVFHGGHGTGAKIAKQTGFSGYADREGFIAVYPDGIEHNWNDGRGTTDAERLGVDDVKFVRALVEHLKATLPVDAARIYAAGVSNGGIFTHRLGCEAADLFAAIGVDVAAIATNLAPRCHPARPVSVVAIQGTADPFIPIQGGEEGWQSGLGDGGLLESAERTEQLWAAKNGCEAIPTGVRLLPRVQDGTHVSQHIYSKCQGGSAVHYYLVDGMGHIWPPKPAQAPRISGPSSQNLDATEVFWEFFSQHPRE